MAQFFLGDFFVLVENDALFPADSVRVDTIL